MKLLIVDDEQQIREGIRRYIQSLPLPFCEVRTACDGQEALAYDIYCNQICHTHGRESWDTAALLYAVRGEASGIKAGEWGQVMFDAKGRSSFRSHPPGNARILYLAPGAQDRVEHVIEDLII